MKISRLFSLILIYPLISLNFVLYAQETANFSADITEVCTTSGVTFTDNSTGFGDTATIYIWSFGVGAVPDSAFTKGPHVVSYTNCGEKNVTLTVKDTAALIEDTETKNNYIDVYAPLDPGSIGSDQTICYNTSPAQFTSIQDGADTSSCATPTNFDSYQWQKKIVAGSWTDISGATSNDYTESDNLTETTQYRRGSIPKKGCNTVYTDAITVTVYNDVDGGQIGSSHGICNGGDPNPFTNITSPSGGDGAWTYDWEYQTNCTGGWTSLGVNSLTYDLSALAETTCYRRVATNGCGTAYSNTITVTVYAVLLPGSIGSSQNICYNTTPAGFTNEGSASGGGGFNYQWQDKVGAGSWTNIGGATSATFTETNNLTQTTLYRRAAISTQGCGTVYSNEVTVNVYTELVPGTIGSNQAICYSITPAGFTNEGSASGGGGFNYQWQDKVGAGSWTNIGGATSATFTETNNLTQTTLYRRAAISTQGCGTVYSNEITVTVYAELLGGTIGSDQEICNNDIPAAFTNEGLATGGGGFIYQWQDKVGAGSWTDITGATNPTFTETNNLTQTTQYRRAAISTQGCGTAYSNVITVTVYAYPLDNLAVSDPVICLNETASIIVGNSETTVSYQLRLDSDNSPVGASKNGTGGDLTFDVTPSSTTVYNIYATTISSTCSVELSQTSTVTVNPLPNQYEVIGGGSYCAGGDGKPVYLAVSETGFSYQLQRDGTDVGSPVDGTGLSIEFGDQTAAGTYTVIATNQITSCQNDMSGSVNVIINPLPTAYNVTGGGSYCASGPGVPVDLSDSETGVDYQLKVDGADTGSPVAGNGSAISFGNQTTEGTYTVFATNATTGCTSTMTGSVDVIIKPLPEAAISGGGTICQGETTDVIISLTGTPDFTFVYAINAVNQPPVNTSNDSYTINTGTNGTYTLFSVDDAICSGGIVSGSAVVTVNPLPVPQNVLGGGSYCSGSSGVEVTLSGSENNVDYQLLLDGVNTGSPVAGDGTPITFGNQTGAGTYTVTATNSSTGCFNTMTGSVDITIDPIPVASFTSTQVCRDFATDFDASSSTISTGSIVQYEWDFDNNGTYEVNSGASTSETHTFVSAGTHTVRLRVTSDKTCQHTITNTVTVDPIPVASFTASRECLNDATTFNADGSSIITGSIVQYEWDFDNNGTFEADSGGTDIGAYIFGSSGINTVRLRVTSDLGCQHIFSNSVTVDPLPVLSFTSSVECFGDITDFDASGSTVSTGSIAQYEWDFDNNGTYEVNSGSNTAETNTFTSSGALTVGLRVTTDQSCQETTTNIVTVNQLPLEYSVTGGGPYCIGGTGVEVGLSGSEVGIDYQLQKDGSNIGTAVSGTGSAISFGNQTEAGNYTVVATNTTTGCINSMTGSVDVVINPLPTPVISGDQQVCENDQGLSYSTPYIDGHNYNWLVTGGLIAYGQNTHSVIVDWGSAGTGTVKVLETIDATGCDSTSSDYSVTIYPLPSTPTITGELSYCAGSTTTLISSAGVGYLWSTGEATQSIDVGEGDYSVQTTDVNGCQSLVSSTVTVIEIPLPTATISGDAAICDDGSEAIITVNLTGTAPWEITYQIDGANDSTITNINSSPYKFNTLIPGQYSISQVSDTFCTGNSFGSVTITVNPLPDVKIIGLYTYYNINKDTVNLNATPPGGNFYGSSGIDNYEKVFKPSDAGLGDHNIIYTYTDNNLCTNYDTVKVTVIDAEGEITSLSGNDDFIYCYDGAIDTIQGSSAGGEIGGRFSGNGIDSIDLDLATFNPILAGPGTHRIIYTYIKDSVSLDIVEFFTVDSIGEIDFVGLDQEYCINNEAVELTPILPTDGGGSGTMTFSGSTGISVDIFDPGSAVIGIDTVILTYIRDYSGCKKILNRVVQIYDIPHLDFAISDGCVNERDSTIFFNLTSSIDPVIKWKWDFDDPASLEENTSDQMTPKHQYPGFGRRSIEMIGITDKNCRDTLVRDIDFEEKPLAGFEWENECYSENKSIPFRDKTFSNSPITNYLWKFYDTNGTDTLATYNTKDTDFVFPTQSDYSIELIVNTANGCTDTINQTIQLRPTIRLIDEVYFEDFESGPQGWIAEAADFSVNSWEFGLPSNNIINSAASGNTAWVTDLNGNYFDGEDSWITSPCFDFREMNRPMIKMNILINSEGDRDGAILQFSTNNGIDWNRVGEYGDGKSLGWFNSVGILGNPGGQQQGWSGTGNNDWQEVRHDLDPLIGSNGVQFRVAFGAGAEGNMEGFAFDNVWIGERTRKVILEHFTNTAESQSEKADSTVNAIANKDTLDIIDIQYHTSFPGSNVLNEYYPAGPGARTIYYGISCVPYSVMDGWEYFEGFDDQNNYLWKESNLIKRSLIDPQVQINLDAKILNGTTLSIDVKVDTLKSIPSNHEVTLHIVILENQVEEGDKTYENVIRKMLPDPGGTPITTGLAQGSVSITESWSFNVSEIDPAALIVVAFVQDEETGEIFQAASVNYAVITGITFPVSGIRELSFNVYPNPSSGKTYLLFSEPLQEDYSLRIFNNIGALIENKVLRNGVQYNVLDTENYQNGIYFIRIMKGNKTIGIKRLSVIH